MYFFNDTATTEIYTLSLLDALPICFGVDGRDGWIGRQFGVLAEMQLDRLHQANGKRAEQLQPRAAHQGAVGFEREGRKVAVQRVGGNVDLIFDLVWRFRLGGCREAFR